MSKTFRPYTPDQLLLLPPSLREWLPEDHPVYFVYDLVETMDLAPILSSYEEERGFPPYHPVLMTKLIVYGYVRGIRSSRKVQRPAWRTWFFVCWPLGKRRTFARLRLSGPVICSPWKGSSAKWWICVGRRAWSSWVTWRWTAPRSGPAPASTRP